MILLTDIYKSVNTLLKSKYGTTIKIYGHEVTEGFIKPSFFTSLIPVTNSNDSINFKSKAFTVMITYFQSIANEIDNLQKADEIISLFGYFLTINGRKIRVTDADYEFIGENNNILQVSIEIEYLESNERTETNQIMQTLNMNEEMR